MAGHLTESAMAGAYLDFAESAGKIAGALLPLADHLDYGSRNGAVLHPNGGATSLELPEWFTDAFEDPRDGSGYTGPLMVPGKIRQIVLRVSSDPELGISDISLQMLFVNAPADDMNIWSMNMRGDRSARYGRPPGMEVLFRGRDALVDANGRLEPVTYPLREATLPDALRTLVFVRNTQQMLLQVIGGEIPAQVMVQDGLAFVSPYSGSVLKMVPLESSRHI